MKKLFKVVLIAGCMVLAGTLAKAQNKIGYVNFNAVIDVMPDKLVIQKTLQTETKQYSDGLQGMQAEYQAKLADYQKGQAGMNDAVRLAKEGELTDMQKRMQDYNTTAQQKLDQRQQELAKPLFDKVKLAVNGVAKEKGYAYVFDSSQQIMLVSPDSDDLTEAVKTKLGIVAAAPAAKK
ncbi:OmpH family outer membrane protein [uncultured Mucilaginibacter sp.]|uniref:OmpH family outer membrane protein n=1 Tax=uncultured Mucilaginibacter sp. TaxID=797541 RepID=UPI0025D3ABBA|nr:OmpH family outer membrane protein [uncultured Mucilaginibacter sp.]